MKRLLRKAEYEASHQLEKLIGYLVTRRSGIRLDKHHFEQIIEHFEESGGHLDGIQGKKNHNKNEHYEKLHGSIDHILKKNKMK
ncbi:hypothetical protein D3C81_500630 [compost metagenome]